MLSRFAQPVALAVLACLSAPLAIAQDAATEIHPQYLTDDYGTARGWSVHRLKTPSGPIGCRAIDPGGQLWVEAVNGDWRLVLPTGRQDVFDGGVIEVDGAVIDSQFGFEAGKAWTTLSEATLERLNEGSRLSVRINGEGRQTWPLSGSAAAILMLRECRDTGDVPPDRTAQAGPPPAGTEDFGSGYEVATDRTQYPQPYARVRDWKVWSIGSAQGFLSCRAVRGTGDDILMIDLEPGRYEPWSLIRRSTLYPGDDQGMFEGGLFGVDGRSFDAEVGLLTNGYAQRDLTEEMRRMVRDGSTLTLAINNDTTRHYALSGSAAAMLKVQECVDRQGRVAAVAPAAAPQRPVVAPPPAPTPLEVSHTRCASFFGDYACALRQQPAEPGYIEVFTVVPEGADEPSYYFKALNDSRAEVWVSFDAGDWDYAGYWTRARDQCSRPEPVQSDAARATLGHDTWELCF